MPPRRSTGFTLLEMTIALAVMGLLVGGIVGGNALLNAARLNAVGTSLQSYENAVHLFQARYKALPGDMTNATSLWGTASGGCPNGVGSGTQTCNGNGNAYIDNDSGGVSEGVRAWQHLSNAGLINGQFSGVQNSGSNKLSLGANIPKARMNSIGFSINSVGTGAEYAFSSVTPFVWSNGSYSRLSFFAGTLATLGATAGGFLPAELLRLDGKFDDGLPHLGKMQTLVSTSCATATSIPAAYSATASSRACPLHFIAVPFPLAH